MNLKVEHDYVDVKTTDFVKAVEVNINERGVYVNLQIHDYTNSGEPYIEFHAGIPWGPLMEEGLIELVNDCRGGRDSIVDVDGLTEARDEWIAMLEKFIERLRMLPDGHNKTERVFA